MIGLVQGTVQFVDDRSCVVLTSGGVGYEIFATGTALAALTIGAPATFHVFTSVREDAITLYGFSSPDEKKLFLMLTDVDKVGPRIGLSILSSGTVPQIIGAIMAGNAAFFSAISGIGKKTAEKILIDMRDKVHKIALSADVTPATGPDTADRQAREAEMGLIALGYHPSTVKAALAKITGKTTKRAEEIVREALGIIREQPKR
ncbi:MAG TPA: Holliday junction branch migration protein RuvA [bacterium]|nr:Holliday junction branch migration protein RuvA [bacterium]